MEGLMTVENTGVSTRSTTTEMATTRQAQEVQAAMVIAKRFPRNEMDSINRVLTACKRPRLAQQAMYEYPRGGQKVTGASIRLAEAIAQNWGNIDFGIVELEQRNGESIVEAYAWDLETNTRQVKVFNVPHVRGTKKGNIALTDPRDIYEMVANQGARRLRACILGVIPGDVVDDALEECEKTVRGQNKKPLKDRIREGVQLFEEKFSVTKEMLEKFIGCKAEAFSENDMLRLNKVFVSLKDGMASREDYFEVGLDEKKEESISAEVKDPFADATEQTKPKKEKKSEKDEKQQELDLKGDKKE